jgi:hypothetical protein
MFISFVVSDFEENWRFFFIDDKIDDDSSFFYSIFLRIVFSNKNLNMNAIYN